MGSAPGASLASRDTAAHENVTAYLAAHEARSTLRFLTCGSVDDGKSTLIGRLLYESNLILDDQLSALKADSAKVGTRGDDLDFALLVDGLAAEREQGITIDVAYRFFTTAHRQFIVADTPGHVQYTRNMVTGASTADLAVILVDGTKGLLDQTRRHTHLVALMGIGQVILAVNKLDLVGFDRELFERIDREYREFAVALGIERVTAIPLSAAQGDNLTSASEHTPWYTGPTLIGALESARVGAGAHEDPMRFAVQWVNRPDASFRGFSGQVIAGTVQPGDEVVILPSGTSARVARIVTADGDLPAALPGSSVTLTLDDEVDVSRGDVISAADDAATVSDHFVAHLVWMHEAPLVPGRGYLIKIGACVVGASIARPDHVLDVAVSAPVAADTLELNDIGRCAVSLDAPVVLERYRRSRGLGGFILIDRLTNDTVAAGMIDEVSPRGSNLHWQQVDLGDDDHAALNGHRGALVWLTGLSGAGKSTIANALERRLHDRGVHTFLLDGDNVRHGLCRDLGFSPSDRAENIRRVGEVAKLMTQAGLVVIAAFISPYAAERRAVRDLFGGGAFTEVHVDTPLAVAAARDPKGLYAKARRGELVGFTGVDAPYEAPEAAEIRIDATRTDPAEAAGIILDHLVEVGVVPNR